MSVRKIKLFLFNLGLFTPKLSNQQTERDAALMRHFGIDWMAAEERLRETEK